MPIDRSRIERLLANNREDIRRLAIIPKAPMVNALEQSRIDLQSLDLLPRQVVTQGVIGPNRRSLNKLVYHYQQAMGGLIGGLYASLRREKRLAALERVRAAEGVGKYEVIENLIGKLPAESDKRARTIIFLRDSRVNVLRRIIEEELPINYVALLDGAISFKRREISHLNVIRSTLRSLGRGNYAEAVDREVVSAQARLTRLRAMQPLIDVGFSSLHYAIRSIDAELADIGNQDSGTALRETSALLSENVSFLSSVAAWRRNAGLSDKDVAVVIDRMAARSDGLTSMGPLLSQQLVASSLMDALTDIISERARTNEDVHARALGVAREEAVWLQNLSRLLSSSNLPDDLIDVQARVQNKIIELEGMTEIYRHSMVLNYLAAVKGKRYIDFRVWTHTRKFQNEEEIKDKLSLWMEKLIEAYKESAEEALGQDAGEGLGNVFGMRLERPRGISFNYVGKLIDKDEVFPEINQPINENEMAPPGAKEDTFYGYTAFDSYRYYYRQVGDRFVPD